MNCRIVDVHRLMVSGKLKCTELSEMCLQRIRDTIKLNCYITVNDQNALEAAKKSDDRYKNGKSLGVLDGIPVAIKDNFSTANIRTTCASRMLENYVPTYSATVVDKLCEQNGAILLGKTNMDEFAMGCSNIDSYFGACKNPWSPSFGFKVVHKDGRPYEIKSFQGEQKENNKNEDDWLISGGSSGGSAVAVASGSCFAALGSDTGGSTRNPSSHVGVVGFKPSYGLLSRYGLIPLTHSMDTPSIIARSVEDISVVFHSIRGHDLRDSTSVKEEIKVPIKECRLENIKIGIPQEYESDAMADEIKLAWNQIADLLANRGAKVNQVSLPHTPYSSSCYLVINCSEVASNLACYDGIEYGYRAQSVPGDSFEDLITRSRHQGFGNLVKSRILSGNFFLLQENYEKFFLKALKIRRLVCEDFDFVFNGEDRVDFLLTPVTPHPAYRISEWNNRNAIDDSQDEDFCTQPSNLAGLPAITLPCKITKDGRPIGLQLIGPKYSDYFLLSLANVLEKLVEFPSLIYDGDEKKLP